MINVVTQILLAVFLQIDHLPHNSECDFSGKPWGIFFFFLGSNPGLDCRKNGLEFSGHFHLLKYAFGHDPWIYTEMMTG